MMIPSPRAILALAATGLFWAGSNPTLRVLRASPADETGVVTEIAVTFDRPVAGSLDQSVDPEPLLRIEPALPGRAYWRDPVTIVYAPSVPLRPDTRYTVTVSNDFRAMDGTRLAGPHRFTFRARGPTLITGTPANEIEAARHLTPDARFNTVWSAPVDTARLSSTAYVELGANCRGPRTVRLRAVSQRRLAEDDPWRFRMHRRGVEPDTMRRVVRLEPVQPLPLDCTGFLTLPSELTQTRTQLVRWPFSTYGAFTLDSVSCGGDHCPTGPVLVRFGTLVRGADVQRHVKLLPETQFRVNDTNQVSDRFYLFGALKPRSTYAVAVDTAMRDYFGQRLTGNPARVASTTGYAPSVQHPYGRVTVERAGFGTLAVQHINHDTLVVEIAAIPDSLEPIFVRRAQWGLDQLWPRVASSAVRKRIPVANGRDRLVTTGVRLDDAFPNGSSRRLLAVRVRGASDTSSRHPIAVVQVTDLGVHSKLGPESGVVWVTGVSDGRPRPGVAVSIHDHRGVAIGNATTDTQGVAHFASLRRTARPAADAESEEQTEEWEGPFEGYVIATLGDDRALVGVSEYDPDLSPWNFNVEGAWGSQRLSVAAAVFTERGIYRPGEVLHAKAIMRQGALGSLTVAPRDSLRWTFTDRDGGTLTDTVVTLSAFGTADHELRIPDAAPLGTYAVQVQAWRTGEWHTVASGSYRVAEYRPPEFLVDVDSDGGSRFPGDTMRALIQARYLFGAPMGRAAMTWSARSAPMDMWALEIPNTDGFVMGETGLWWEEERGARQVDVFASGTDSLDAAGRQAVAVALPEPARGRGARVTFSATITDVNRQTVGTSTSITVHPAEFYLGVKPIGRSYFWNAGEQAAVEVIAVRPGGERVRGVAVSGVVTRREWHRAHRIRDGVAEVVGEWVTDTVSRCNVTTTTGSVRCSFTPKAAGSYYLTFRARDARGREAVTGLYRWAAGAGWVAWDDEHRFRMDVIPDRQRYSVGDTATIMLASPVTDAEAWLTVEREGVIEQRRMRITSGATTIKLPITEAFVPNAYVGVVVARGRTAAPGKLDDVGRPSLRVGYTELRVIPEVKRLAVEVTPGAEEYRPGDSATVRVRVRDGRGGAQRSEVTLWAVDEGVLSLTGYRTPDPLELLYRPRGLGLRLASNMVAVAPQIPEGEKGRRDPGGGGGADAADILRSQFRTTAFFLGSVITDANGIASVRAKLPDNITTFRVMAVAVTTGDRFGSGQSPMLVTRPLIARPALPRFVRAGDSLVAGVVVNQRTGGTPTVRVDATAQGVTLRGNSRRDATLEAGRGSEVRYPFRVGSGDSAVFQFAVRGAAGEDAVRTRLPIRPEFHSVTHTIAGVVRDTATAEFVLPGDIDPARSRISINLGSSPLAVLQGLREQLRLYPYYCTEQLTSVAMPLLALYKAQRTHGLVLVDANGVRDLERAVTTLSRRQRTDGGIGMWRPDDWTTPYLTAHATRFLIGAREAGIVVNDSVLARAAGYLVQSLASDVRGATPVAHWYTNVATVLSDQVAAVDVLSRLGVPQVPAENRLLARAAQLRVEDRLRLAEAFHRRGEQQAALRLIAPAWASVKLEGRRAAVPADTGEHYFRSTMGPTARLLAATLAINPTHPLVAPLVESLVSGNHARGWWSWNTHDAALVVEALAAAEQTMKSSASRTVRARAGQRVLAVGRAGTADSSATLGGLLTRRPDGSNVLRIAVDAQGDGMSYWFATVTEVPRTPPVAPRETGIAVERWYESYETGRPVTAVTEGELVRVRLRVTVARERHFVVLDDALPAGLEAVDLSLRTAAPLPGPGVTRVEEAEEEEEADGEQAGFQWGYGRWDGGWWTPFDHRELRDDRVVYVASVLWPGTYTATYVARATTPGVFTRPPAHAQEMYNPAVYGRSDGGVFTVRQR